MSRFTFSGKRVDICWLVRVGGHLHKVEKEQQRLNILANSPEFARDTYAF